VHREDLRCGGERCCCRRRRLQRFWLQLARVLLLLRSDLLGESDSGASHESDRLAEAEFTEGWSCCHTKLRHKLDICTYRQPPLPPTPPPPPSPPPPPQTSRSGNAEKINCSYLYYGEKKLTKTLYLTKSVLFESCRMLSCVWNGWPRACFVM